MLAEYDFYDERLAPLFAKYQNLNLQKESVGQKLSVLSAAALTQQIFNALAQTDTQNHYRFLDEVGRFHAEVKVFFYTKIFQNKTFKLADFEQIPKYEFKKKAINNEANNGILLLLVSVIVVSGIGIMMRK